MDNVIDLTQLGKNKPATPVAPEQDDEPMNTWVFQTKDGQEIVDDGYFAITPSFVALLDGPGAFSVVVPLDNLLSATNLGPVGEGEPID